MYFDKSTFALVPIGQYEKRLVDRKPKSCLQAGEWLDEQARRQDVVTSHAEEHCSSKGAR